MATLNPSHPPATRGCPAPRCVMVHEPLSITGSCHCKCVLMTMTHDTKQKGTHWSVTQFGIAEGTEQMAAAHQRGWVVQGQEETCPTSGRKHWQLHVHTPHMRMSQVIKHFRGAHVEPARNVPALQAYVVKEETRSGALPDLSKYPTLNDFWTLTHGLMTNPAPDDAPEWVGSCAPRQSIIHRRTVTTLETLTRNAEEEDPDHDRHEDRVDPPHIWAVARYLVRRGFHVEMMVANPQLKEAWKQSFWACMLRTHNAVEARRQTAATDTAELPTHNRDITHADSPSEESLPQAPAAGGAPPSAPPCPSRNP